MSDYTKSTNFAAKDALASGNAAKVVKGTEIDTEFNNIATAIATKTDDSSAAITGGTIDGTAIGGTTPAAGAFTTLSASGVSSFADGSASAPAITNTGDTNTGIFFPAADTIAFAEGGTETMRLDSAGNMGLGVTPSAWGSLKSVDVSTFGGFFGFNNQAGVTSNAYFSGTSWTYKGSGPATLYQQIGGAHNWQIATSGTAGNAITFTQAMTLDASGNLGIGTTSPAKKLDVSTGDIRLSSGYTVQWGGTANYIYGDSTSNFFVVATNGAERARIDSSGNLLVGTTSSWVTARVAISGTSSDAAATIKVGTNGNYGISLYNSSSSLAGGIIVNSGSVAYNTTSDYRLKDTIAPITGALSKVIALKPCTYKWKADGSDGEGFIAHELAEICPHAVTGEKDATQIEQYEISPAVPATFDDDGNELTPAVEAVMGEREVPVYQGIDTSFLVATLTAAIQEQQALITSLTARIEALEAK